MARAVKSYSLVEYMAGKDVRTICSPESYLHMKGLLLAQGEWMQFKDQYDRHQYILKSTVIRIQELD